MSGELILRTLHVAGWAPSVQARPQGGVRVTAQHELYGRVGPVEGSSLADVASDLLERCLNARHTYRDEELADEQTTAAA
jgi:hypothetical protein